jgi:hypothetical protein
MGVLVLSASGLASAVRGDAVAIGGNVSGCPRARRDRLADEFSLGAALSLVFLGDGGGGRLRDLNRCPRGRHNLSRGGRRIERRRCRRRDRYRGWCRASHRARLRYINRQRPVRADGRRGRLARRWSCDRYGLLNDDYFGWQRCGRNHNHALHDGRGRGRLRATCTEHHRQQRQHRQISHCRPTRRPRHPRNLAASCKQRGSCVWVNLFSQLYGASVAESRCKSESHMSRRRCGALRLILIKSLILFGGHARN